MLLAGQYLFQIQQETDEVIGRHDKTIQVKTFEGDNSPIIIQRGERSKSIPNPVMLTITILFAFSPKCFLQMYPSKHRIWPGRLLG